MQISVPLVNGQLADEYGKYAPAEDLLAGYPIKSFPINISGAPAGTKSFAIVFVDYDSTPVCGFTWIHWLAANLPATMTSIPANASREANGAFVQGHNSNAGRLVNGDQRISQGYVGPQPPDKDHNYTLMVYALDDKLDLADGYWLNDFIWASAGHVLAKAEATLPSRV